MNEDSVSLGNAQRADPNMLWSESFPRTGSGASIESIASRSQSTYAPLGCSRFPGSPSFHRSHRGPQLGAESPACCTALPTEEIEMGCRIGMATDVDARVQQLKNSGLVPQHARHRILNRYLTYTEATDYERAARQVCGPPCQGSAGGPFVSGRMWNVYRIDW